jgi:hypothetical protein
MFNERINGRASKEFKTYRGVLNFAKKHGITNNNCRLFYCVKDEDGRIYQSGFISL